MYLDNQISFSGYSTHFQVGGNNSKVEGGILQNQYAKQSLKFYINFDIFIFENKVAEGKCNLAGTRLLWNALHFTNKFM